MKTSLFVYNNTTGKSAVITKKIMADFFEKYKRNS